MFFLAFDSSFLGRHEGTLVLGGLVVGRRAYLEDDLDEVQLLVVVALLEQPAGLDEVIVSPAEPDVELALELPNKGFSFRQMVAEDELMFLFGVDDRPINKLYEHREVVFIF
jgi:SpoVK/Ycf46/Vps4 family AAA+-type ATPase